MSRGRFVLRTATGHAVPYHGGVGPVAIQDEANIDMTGLGIMGHGRSHGNGTWTDDQFAIVRPSIAEVRELGD